MHSLSESSPARRVVVAAATVAVLISAWIVFPVVAAPLAGVDSYPRVVVLARHDVPFDALGAGAVAAQLGAPVIITSPTSLSETARQAIVEADPEVILVAGGPVAITEQVATDAAAACDPDCTVDRRGGGDRDGTAALLAQVGQDYGFGGPLLAGDQQSIGDAHLGGTLHTDAITVQSTQRVQGLNADRVDGVHASQLVQFPLVVADRGSPRLGSPSVSGVTAEERGDHVAFTMENFTSNPVAMDVWLDLPAPVGIGDRPMRLVRIELCHRTLTTDASIVEVEVQSRAAARTVTTWSPSLPLPYPHTESVPYCIDLEAPAIAVDGVAVMRVRIQETDSSPTTNFRIHGVSATWAPA